MSKNSALRTSRGPLWLIVACFVLPLLIAFVMHYAGANAFTGNRNHGTLIVPPRALPEILIPTSNGARRDLRELMRARWGLLFFQPVPCEDNCRREIEQLRRAHVLADKNPQRILRVVVTSGPQIAGNPLDPVNDNTGILSVTDVQGEIKALRDSLAPPQDRRAGALRLVIVDPRGFLVSSYADPISWQGVLKDLQRLLRYSWIG